MSWAQAGGRDTKDPTTCEERPTGASSQCRGLRLVGRIEFRDTGGRGRWIPVGYFIERQDNQTIWGWAGPGLGEGGGARGKQGGFPVPEPGARQSWGQARTTLRDMSTAYAWSLVRPSQSS